jgi:hypothetical protein
MTNSKWITFLPRAISTLECARAGSISIIDALDFFDAAQEIKSCELRRYFLSLIDEIDGSPTHYQELIDLLRRGATEDDIILSINRRL